MTYAVTDPVVLPPDAALVRVDDLPDDLRAEIDHQPGDHALTRPLSRHPSTIVDLETAELLEEFRSPTRIIDAVIGYSTAQRLDPAETLERAFPVLQGFMNAGLLVPADSELAQPIETSLQPESHGRILGDRSGRARDGRHRGLSRHRRDGGERCPQARATGIRGAARDRRSRTRRRC